MLCLTIVESQIKQILFILPMSYLVSIALFKSNYRNITSNISKLLIETLFFVRNVILPMMYSAVSKGQLFEGKVAVEGYFFEACLLMVYEAFTVQLILYIYEHVKKRRFRRTKKYFIDIDLCKYLIIFMVFYIVVISIFAPQYGASFKTIFQLGEIDFSVSSNRNEYVIGTMGRVFRTLYSLMFLLVRILFPAYLLKRNFERNSKKKNTTVILVVGCAAQFLFLTSTFAEAIISCLVLILYYINLYPNRRKKVFIFLIGSTVGALILYFSIRYIVRVDAELYSKDNGIVGYAAEIVNAYFTGVDNVAAIFNIPKGFEKSALKADILGAIPFNATLFGNIGERLQYYYNEANMAYGQIPPTLGCGYYYFGWALSPIISILFVMLSMRYNEMAESKKRSFRYIAEIYCSVVFALGTVMYSLAITLQLYFSCGLFLLLITRLSGSSERKESTRV